MSNQEIDELLKALKTNPENAEIRIAIGDLYDKDDQPYKAIETFKEALIHDPENAHIIHAALSSLYLETGQHNKAIPHIKKVAEWAQKQGLDDVVTECKEYLEKCKPSNPSPDGPG